MTAAASQAIRFDTKPCSRCGGSGRYSYNQIDGDRCYGCGGAGVQLSKKGAAARKAYDEAIDAVSLRPAFTVRAGDRVQYPGRRGWQTVERVQTDWIDPDHTKPLRISGAPGRINTSIFCARETYAAQAGTNVRVFPGNEAVRAVQDEIAARFSGATIEAR